jgi:hypothetical protein
MNASSCVWRCDANLNVARVVGVKLYPPEGTAGATRYPAADRSARTRGPGAQPVGRRLVVDPQRHVFVRKPRAVIAPDIWN